MDKLVSIILPTYNGGKYTKRAIESVISQTFLNWELLVVDDGSTDNTKDVVISFSAKDRRVIYLKNENNLGIQKTLNMGINEARGAYIARIDDDDEWIDKDKLLKQVKFLSNNPEHVLVGTGVVVVDKKEKELFRYLLPETDEQIRSKILTKNCFIHSSVMFIKDVALKTRGYNEDENIKHVEDYDLWLKLGILGKLANLPIYAVSLTLREGSISSTNKKEQFKKDIKLIKKYNEYYPNHFMSLIKGYARLNLYRIFFRVTPVVIVNRLHKIYKKNIFKNLS